MYLSCCTWALSGDPHQDVNLLSGAGFTHIDIRAIDFADQDKKPDLPISCVGLSFGLPEGYDLDDSDMERSIEAGGHLRRALEHAVWAGADSAYVVPGFDLDPSALSRFAGHLVHLADQAQEYGIRISIEHFPQRSLPTIDATLKFIKSIGHPNLYLLLDIGHAQISNEDPVEAIEAAGDRLGYVHLDDNDGRDDLHLALCDGVLTEDGVKRTIQALRDCNYEGGISIELNSNLDNPFSALVKSRDIILNVSNNQVM